VPDPRWFFVRLFYVTGGGELRRPVFQVHAETPGEALAKALE
jgi:hypothetical protein